MCQSFGCDQIISISKSRWVPDWMLRQHSEFKSLRLMKVIFWNTPPPPDFLPENPIFRVKNNFLGKSDLFKYFQVKSSVCSVREQISFSSVQLRRLVTVSQVIKIKLSKRKVLYHLCVVLFPRNSICALLSFGKTRQASIPIYYLLCWTKNSASATFLVKVTAQFCSNRNQSP
jgi:hypothetical protein